MASPCEILFDGIELDRARFVAAEILQEVRRIEAKLSRYRVDSVVSRINASAGRAIPLDEEMAQLIDYAEICFRLSEGRFDITSGVLRKAWRFDGADESPPDPALLESLCRCVGWHKVVWQRPVLQLAPGMEIDLGGIGKEYAVDRAAALARAAGLSSVLVNFGGDLAVCGPRADGRPWMVGCWDNRVESHGPQWAIRSGAIATSGSTQRFFMHQGKRFGHILDPRSGRPVEDAPLSISVSAATCSEAGTFSTLAMLQGGDAEAFLEAQGLEFRCLR
jgi:thiamine biosynthesis lipoprotein